jgi:hypothetical protein
VAAIVALEATREMLQAIAAAQLRSTHSSRGGRYFWRGVQEMHESEAGLFLS